MMAIKIQVIGVSHDVDVDDDIPLLWVLRDVIGMTGTKFGCGKTLCGACTVQVNGTPMRSCILPVSSVGESYHDNRRYRRHRCWPKSSTGLARSGGRSVRLLSVWANHVAAALLAANSNPNDSDIDAAMSGNICRCGT